MKGDKMKEMLVILAVVVTSSAVQPMLKT